MAAAITLQESEIGIVEKRAVRVGIEVALGKGHADQRSLLLARRSPLRHGQAVPGLLCEGLTLGCSSHLLCERRRRYRSGSLPHRSPPVAVARPRAQPRPLA